MEKMLQDPFDETDRSELELTRRAAFQDGLKARTN
jgi:hypothetical protein